MSAPIESLVKYETPVLLTESVHAKAQRAKKKAATATASGSAVAAAAAIPQPEDVLYSIVPPRQFEDKGQKWVQYPSSVPATRLDIINLQERLDELLQERQARETGICPIREELYGQAFDEIIRQVTVNCAERGLLLLRVRDEARMTLDAYRSLYESSTAFGIRKALQAEQGRTEMEAHIRALEREKEDLQRQVQELEAECDQMESAEALRREEEDKKHAEEVAFFRRTYQTLTSNLQTVVNPSK